MRKQAQSASQMKKGFLRLFILANLYKGPLHGYAIIRQIAAKSNGFWAPKAGNIYPLLHDMVREGLVQPARGEARRRVYAITAKGQSELLRLFGEAEDVVNHLVDAMNRDDGEWIRTHLRLLDELSPPDREKRLRSLVDALDALIRVLARTKARLEQGMGSRGRPEGSREAT